MTAHPWGAVVELAASQHGVLSHSQAAAIASRSNLRTLIRNGVLERASPGVLRVSGSPATWHQQLMGATLAASAPTASIRSAARLHRLDGFLDIDSVEVTTLRGASVRIPGAVVHRISTPFESSDVLVVDGVRTTSIARTLCDLGAMCPQDLVERALDDALRRGTSLKWITATANRLDRPGPAGVATVLRILKLPDRLGIVPESWRERVTERLLASAELGNITRQHELRGPTGALIARFDLAVVDAKVGIEFHSDQWHYGPRRGRGDRRRDFLAAQVGWEIIYLDASDHRSPAATLRAVREVIRARPRAA